MNRDETFLFRWAGKHIEGTLRKDVRIPNLKPEKREAYLKLLGDALNENRGLYAQVPKGDFLGNGEKIRLTRPCLCFTELRLGESNKHWQKFGRMAFGFTKHSIAQWGGGSVSYISGTQGNILVKRLEKLHAHLNNNSTPGNVTEAFDYLCHFFKRMRGVQKPKTKTAAHLGLKAEPKKSIRPPTKEEMAAKRAKFQGARSLPYLNEEEWRLVYSENHDRWRRIGSQGLVEKAWFRVLAGEELQVVILPDNRTVQRVLQCSAFTQKLFAPGRPPVQLISLEAVVRI